MQNYGIFHFPFNFTASSHCMFALRLPSALYRKSGESLLWFYLLLNFTLVPPAARSPPAAPCPRGPPFTQDLRAACPGRGLSSGRPPCPRGPPHLGAPQPPQRARSRRPAGRGTAPVPAQSPPCRGAGPAASAPGRAPCEAPGLWWKRLRSRVRPARWRRRPAQLRAWGCRWRAEPGHGVFKGSGAAPAS